MSSILWPSSAVGTTNDLAADRSKALSNAKPEDKGNVIYLEIQAETRGELNLFSPETMCNPSSLGCGTSFEVDRVLFHQKGGVDHYVAVKRVITRTISTEDLLKRLSVIKRELRVLMHPPLRAHSCVISILGYGHGTDASLGIIPYLVMEYSDHGTLTQYLQRCNISLDERRELALDVGMALRFLHDCQIIHGDVKMDNVLVFDSTDDLLERPQLAKLADFGSALFEDDFMTTPIVRYLGTTKYNAPEIASREGPGIRSGENSHSMFKRADVYSFGLLLLETILGGESFIDKAWLRQGTDASIVKERSVSAKAELAFLNEVTLREEDSLLGLATGFASRLSPQADPSIIHSVAQALMLCLRDDAHQRGSMAQVTKFLAQGTTEDRPHSTHTSVRMISPMTTSSTTHLLRRKKSEINRLHPSSSFNSNIRIAKPDNGTAERVTSTRLRSGPIASQVVYSPTKYQHVDVDMFKASTTISPPWKVQRRVVERLKSAADIEKDPELKAQLHLQLAIVYWLGYGIQPQLTKSLQHLAEAANANSVARCIAPRVMAATKHISPNLEPFSSSELYHGFEDSGICPKSGIVNFLRAKSILTLRPQADDASKVRHKLTSACMEGNFDLAQKLVSLSSEFPSGYAPNPLHWLVMFPHEEAKALLDLLIVGSTDVQVQQHGVCRNVLNASCEGMINLPEYCMDLLGTPLHFAIRCGFQDLVSEFIRYGANVDRRWEARLIPTSDGRSVRYPSFSPLDLAATYHLADIVQLLLEASATTYGGDVDWKYSPFHMIGQKTIPFARFVIHGSHSRAAATETIHKLHSWGIDINGHDSLGQTPLLRAAGHHDIDDYILEELLEAGATTDGSAERPKCSVATLLAQHCADRRFISSQLRLLLPQVDDINDQDGLGRNALHYCALFDGVEMARVLLAQPGIEVDCKTNDKERNTPLLFAATFGSMDVAGLLIEAKANIDMADAKGSSPLEVSVSFRHIDVAGLLIQAGASLIFHTRPGKNENILHYSVMRVSQQPSIVAHILRTLPADKIIEILDEYDTTDWTPLHVATYFGDIEGVEALLEAGANANLSRLPQHAQLINSRGGTPLQLVTRLKKKIEQKGLGTDHEVVKQGGPAAQARFMDRLEEIERVLKKHGAK